MVKFMSAEQKTNSVRPTECAAVRGLENVFLCPKGEEVEIE